MVQKVRREGPLVTVSEGALSSQEKAGLEAGFTLTHGGSGRGGGS